jgi:HSP20 family protein
MQEKQKVQNVPVKVYRSTDRITVAAPLPGLQPEDILVTVTEESHLVIYGEVRGMLKDIKELLIDEWSVGEYHRELELPEPVDGSQANATYGNGVLVVSLPRSRSACSTAAVLRLEKIGLDRGEHVGLAGHIQVKETNASSVPIMKAESLVQEV